MIFGGRNKRVFHVVRTHGISSLEKRKIRIRLEKGLMISLFLLVVLSVFSRRIPERMRVMEYVVGPVNFRMDVVPKTTQGGLPRPPDLPQLPIPSEDEFIPEDETIETTELDLTEGIFLFEGLQTGNPNVFRGGMGPRPIREVIPEYPEAEREYEGIVLLNIRVNHRGKVDSVTVEQNTTASQRLARAAVDAAYQGLYDPPRSAVWIQRPYRFERKR